MIEKGQQIDSNFELDVIQNGEEKTVPFDQLLERPAVVSVYMKNNTPGCDKQNDSLADQQDWFDQKGYNLIAVSKDTCGSHKKYADKKEINYVLASDPDYNFAQATDSMIKKNMFGKTFEGPSRSAYIIDTDGTILAVIAKADTQNHAEQLKEVINQQI